MYQTLKPCRTYRWAKSKNEILFFEVFKVGNEYSLTWRDLTGQGTWMGFRDSVEALVALLPMDAENITN